MTHISLKATGSEVAKCTLLKERMHRNSLSDLLRALIDDAYERFFGANVSPNTNPRPRPTPDLPLSELEEMQERGEL